MPGARRAVVPRAQDGSSSLEIALLSCHTGQNSHIRDLARAREDALNTRRQLRQQLKSLLLRYDVRYPGKASWSQAHCAWLGKLAFAEEATQTALDDYWVAAQAADERLKRLSAALAERVKGWRFAPQVAALQALRGIDVTSAIALVAQDSARQKIAQTDHTGANQPGKPVPPTLASPSSSNW